MAMPWVRLHGIKDYLDMPLRAAANSEIRTTFNLVPSLIDQIELYESGGTDRHLELSRTNAEHLSPTQKEQILRSFFHAHPVRMIEPYRRYHELYRKADSGSGNIVPEIFTTSEIRDLQVWSNLVWVDPLFRGEEPIRNLFATESGFSEDDKQNLLNWIQEALTKIVPTYRRLFRNGNIDISFTPYYHPILPLLCDTDSAKEALPGIALPDHRFRHPEDAREQVRLSIDKFRSLFNSELVGMWPSEGSVSEETAAICAELGLKWLASDEGVLHRSLEKSGLSTNRSQLSTVHEHSSGIKLFFRNRVLSDRIGFVYSEWDADRAVNDFVSHLKEIRAESIDALDRVVVPIILDGENAWEYFPDDGSEFLDLLYQTLAEDPEIETVTFSEAAETLVATKLPQLFSGSWINNNFRIWIGHEEDNTAWDLLWQARFDLVKFLDNNPDFDPRRRAAAWEQIYKAEGSDWCWWFGDEHRGNQNEQFDQIFRRHLAYVYELIGLEAPSRLSDPIHRTADRPKTVPPDTLLTPEIDGRQTYFYEWTGAGYYDCLQSSAAMHRSTLLLGKIHFAYDTDWLYIRLDFADKKRLDSIEEGVLRLKFSTPEGFTIDVPLGRNSGEEDQSDDWRYAYRSIIEVAVKRSFLWSEGFGPVAFGVSAIVGGQVIESYPDNGGIEIDLPRPGGEMFWPS